MLHEAIFLATCNATMTNKKPFKLQRGCYTQATRLATLEKVEGRSTFLQLATQQLQLQNGELHCNLQRNVCYIASCKKIASCNMALSVSSTYNSKPN